jgi:thiamine-phosphate diphosphorylase
LTPATDGGVVAGLPRLHVVTDDAILARADWQEIARAVLAAGGERVALHVRGPGLSGRVIHERVRDLIGPAGEAGAQLFVNDRVDVALTLGTNGIQLREASLPVKEVREMLGADVWIGASVHGPERAADLERDGADFLIVGTVFATPSHPTEKGQGVGLLEQVGRASGLPLVAIGGISPERVRAVRAAGAHGVAVRGGIWSDADVARAVRSYVSALEP